MHNIIKKGMTPLYNGKVLRFKAKTAWKAYQENRSHSCRILPPANAYIPVGKSAASIPSG